MTDETSERPKSTELGILGRIVVAVVALAGLAAAAPSPVALWWYLPYASVATILVVRRPRVSIGWILLVLGWAHVLSISTLDATPGQSASGSLTFTTKVMAIAFAASAPLMLSLYAVLAFVFPSGRLPTGRWGPIARALLVLEAVLLVLVTFAPIINVNLVGFANGALVPNPLAVLEGLSLWSAITGPWVFLVWLVVLAIAAASLVDRFRGSVGIERQQLRWLGAALVLVLMAFGLGLVIGSLDPGALETGSAWLPAILAFPAVPVAVGIAVLRYRLYEIDTVINRAIVYGLLTAILAGASAATIGLMQRLFEGVFGPESDATIVLTTLIVVTAFNPVKTRLQAIVDRRFKEVPSPASDLEAFVREVHDSVSTPDRVRTMRKLLDVAVRGYGASGGEVRAEKHGAVIWSLATGTVTTEPGLLASTSSDGMLVEVRLSGGDRLREEAALQQALVAVLGDMTAHGPGAARGASGAETRARHKNHDRGELGEVESSTDVVLGDPAPSGQP